MHTLAFLGGLHRSGTTLLARLLAAHPDVSAFHDTGVPADEGQHLQDVYLPAGRHGGAGRFGFDPEAHLTEQSVLATSENAERLFASWSWHWNLAQRVLVEKSPANLIRMRFLAALFPEAEFVMIVRHPIVVALATEKWCNAPMASLLWHWLRCHELFESDRLSLDERVRVVRYEDLANAPAQALAGIFAFLDLEPVMPAVAVESHMNHRYLTEWKRRWQAMESRQREYLRSRFAQPFARFGYHLEPMET